MTHARTSRSRLRAAALVTVLSLLVLLTVLIVAFLSRTTIERDISQGATAIGLADILARSTVDGISLDLLEEMRWGNLPSDPAGAALSETDRLVFSYPSEARFVVPHRVLGANAAAPAAMNLLKMSVAGQVSYPSSLFPDGPPDEEKIAAHGGSTATPSRNGRSITPERWNHLKLMTATTGFTPPDWIRVTRRGPETLGQSVPMTAARDQTKPDYVIGRYAYTISNLGGMLDVNVLGNGLPVADNRNRSRGRLHQADFTAIRDPGEPPLDEAALRTRLVQWRWGTSAAADMDWLLDPLRSFLRPDPGQNYLFSRSDLLAFQKQNSDILLESDLACLSTASFERNAPFFDRENHNAAGYDKPENQSIARTRYKSGAKAGERVINQRFDLNRIDLLKQGGSAAEIERCFGLREVGGSSDDWEYAGAAPGGPGFIRTLADIANDASNPEPNFFEVLKAVINQNSLAIDQDGGHNSGGWQVPMEQGRTSDYQIFQIGANIIDQWDEDDDPTRIMSSIGDSVWGVENLPYFNQVFQWAKSVPLDPVNTSPTPGRRFVTWFIPELWNPHRNAGDSTIHEFRIVGIGRTTTTLTSQQGLNAATTQTNSGSSTLSGVSIVFDDNQALGTPGFTEPSLVRNGTLTISASNATAQADTEAQAGNASANFLGLWAGSIPVPDGHDRSTGNHYILQGSPSFGFELQYKKQGAWRTYQRLERFKRGQARGLSGAGRAAFTALWPMGAWSVSDPRCHRGTRSADSQLPDNTANTRITAIRNSTLPPDEFTITPNIFDSNNKIQGTITPETNLLASGVGDQPGLLFRSGTEPWPMTLGTAWNDGAPVNGKRWALLDRDRQMRFADPSTLPFNSAYATINAGKGPLTQPAPVSPAPYRPLILNRAFRNVGELGYALRDQPWKTLNFSLIPYRPSGGEQSGQSADSGLLEVFSLVTVETMAGKVDLNTRNPRVLESLLRNSELWLSAPEGTANTLPAADAAAIASAMTGATASRPVANVADLATYVTSSDKTTAAEAYNSAKWIYPAISSSGIAKEQLEGPLRNLAALGTTRTWNLGLDLIVQAGRYPQNAADPARDFIVQSQQRFFVTLIFDRLEGRLISKHMEPIYE